MERRIQEWKRKCLHLEWILSNVSAHDPARCYSNIESPLNRWATPYSDGACSFITSRASAECAIAAPARISAATQMASMISFSVAPF